MRRFLRSFLLSLSVSALAAEGGACGLDGEAGLRNLCEGNPVVQAQISELEVQKVLDSPEMRAKGVTVQMQPDGKPRFVHAADT
jgi:hypothetical protein